MPHDDLTPATLDGAAPACAAHCPLAGAMPVEVLSVDGHAAGDLDRRTFLSRAMLAAAATALAACGAGGGDAPTSPGSVGATIRVSDYPALTNVGGIATMTLDRTPIAVVRTSASTFVALSRVCPHEGGIVNAVGSGFVCPNHGAQFTATGTWTGGQRTTSLRSYATQYDATTGVITVG